MSFKIRFGILGIVLAIIAFSAFQPSTSPYLQIRKKSTISLIGNNLGSRMINFDHFETELHLRYPDSLLTVRNLCDGGDTPGFRPHSSRNDPWVFPGAEKFQLEFAKNSGSEGHLEKHDVWLSRLKTDIVVAFFGYPESTEGPARVANFKAELTAFIKHTQNQKYNGLSAPQLALVSPIAFEDISNLRDLPNGKKENERLALYTQAMKEVAEQNNVLFLDAFEISKKWYEESKEPLTIDGLQLNDAGYQRLSLFLSDKLFGKKATEVESRRAMVQAAVDEKNWMWHNDFKIPNGVHVYGRRYNPFGPDNYPAEIEKIRQMTQVRQNAIWLAAREGKVLDIDAEDKKTRTLPAVTTNYNPEKNGSLRYLYGEEALKSIQVPTGYKLELFASEEQFPNLAKPSQMTFDNKGRLWVAAMPTYPHYKPGDPKPNDKLLIYEDTNADGKADREIVFADHLQLPVGFEITQEGVFVSQGTNLVLLKDTNGDDKADSKEIIYSGFDDHDSHHEIHAFVSDESGAIYMGEGVFLHTNVETPYGTVRGTNGGFYRFNPTRRHLERVAQLSIPNPWGIAFDRWGQNFFAETSGPDVRWMMPGSVLNRYGEANHKSYNLIEEAHRVRPTSGLEFISSRHFPDEVQGDMLINNTIGFLGMKQHQIWDDGTGYKSKHRVDLVKSEDRNFRPVDMEFAPDGSLYFIDWHNILIGHMQHNARDPLRDHTHGRIYRITYPSRPLVKPAKVFGASIDELLENLKLPEYRTRYRTRRELRGRNVADVITKTKAWVAKLDKNDPNYEHHALEALWVTWGMNKIDQVLLGQLLKAKDYHVRAAAVRAVRYNGHQLPNQAALLTQAAQDKHGRVRLEAIVAASWIGPEKGLPILALAKTKPLDDWMIHTYETAFAHLNGRGVERKKEVYGATNLKGQDLESYNAGGALFGKEGYCGTCHQLDGKGLTASGFPPLSGSKWVTGNQDRLIKLVLKGLMGPMTVNGVKYSGQVPMTPFGGLMNDKDVADVLTYIRNAFGNKGSVVSPQKVKEVRANVLGKKDFYQVDKLLSEHPMED
ncbi:PVC-type heme-binding CxxCH protein [Aquirufa nivalisilvae]|uniref:PVC-type heme-binding CxxCH protein n=1 Tax=Aquirufa nivalisilvae TaxID=2516557 RepID=UPI0022A9E0A3|nr:PVC-type heme-binding CxxCH protein [Aquirufa nivalisilvae]MCZ2480987.1 c-type cytochrome [Aquirufa nivalisilvae]